MTLSLSLKASSYCLLTVRSYSLQVISGKTLAREITPPGAPIMRPFTKKFAEPGITLKVSLTASKKLSMFPVEESLTPTILGCLARSFTRLTDRVVPPQNWGALYTRHGVVRLPATSEKYFRSTGSVISFLKYEGGSKVMKSAPRLCAIFANSMVSLVDSKIHPAITTWSDPLFLIIVSRTFSFSLLARLLFSPLEPKARYPFSLEDRKSTRLNSSHGYI